MKILFVTQEDPFYIKNFFAKFLEQYPHLGEIDGVVLCRTMGEGPVMLARRIWNFFGPVGFVRMGLRYVTNKVCGRVFGALRIKKFFDLRQALHFYGVETTGCDDVNDASFVEGIKARNVDLIISVAAPQKFDKPLLDAAPLGCINIPNARLPSYRAMLPNFWNLYNGEESSAITIHRMDEDLDRGEIILQELFALNPHESLDNLMKRTKALGAKFMIAAVEKMREGKVEYLPYPDVPATYYSFPTLSDVKEFRRRGKRIL